MDTIRLLVGLLLVAGLTACSQSFWDRSPRVAGQVRPAPYVAAPAPGIRAAPPPTYAAPPSAYADAPAATPTADQEREVLRLVNEIRASQGLRALRHSDALYAAARAHSQDQCRSGYMGHESPDPAARTLVQRMHGAGYDGAIYGEVVAWGYSEPRAVVEGWMNSPAHRAILTDREMQEAAFSRVGQYWTGNFGAPYATPTMRATASRPAGTSPWRPTPPTARTPVAQPAPPAVRAPVSPPTPPAAAATRAQATRPPVQHYFAPVQPPPMQEPTYRPPARGG